MRQKSSLLESSLEIEQNERDSEIKDSEITPLHYDITAYPADFTLEVLYQKWNNGDILIPEFQRGFVWDIPRASRLIESIMMGLPVPPLFFYVDEQKRYLVIDGLQRLKSIFSFMGGFWEGPSPSSKRPFAMKGFNPQNPLYGKTFEDFTAKDQRELKNYVLRTIIVQQLNPNDSTSIYHIFQRLNTGGMTLSDQEVRNCVYAGEFNDMLARLNKHGGWRKILGKEKEDNRKKDTGYALRCISLLHNHKKYKKPMRNFLSEFMFDHRNPSPQYIKTEEDLFKKTCDAIVKELGEKPFHPVRSLSPSMLDSIFVAFAQHPDRIPNDIRERFHCLLKNEYYIRAVSSSTTDPDAVRKRLELADAVLFG